MNLPGFIKNLGRFLPAARPAGPPIGEVGAKTATSQAQDSTAAETMPLTKIDKVFRLAACAALIVLWYLYGWLVAVLVSAALTSVATPFKGGGSVLQRLFVRGGAQNVVSPPQHYAATTARSSSAPAATAPASTPAAPVQDILVPELGWQATAHRLNLGFVKPSKADVQNQMLRRQRLDDIEWLKKVFNTYGAQTPDGQHLTWLALKGIIFALLNEKGGASKSTDAVTVGNILARDAGATVLVIPGAKNDGSTTTKANVDAKDTLTLIGLEKVLRDLTKNGTVRASAKEVLAHLHRNSYGVYVVAQEALPNDFGGTRLKWIVEQVVDMVDVVILDMGNDIARTADEGVPDGGNVEYMAACLADVLVFPCSTSIPDSPHLAGKSMDACVVIEQPEKLGRSVFVVNGHRPTDNPDTWRMFAECKVHLLTNIPIGRREFDYGVDEKHEGTLALIRWDNHISGMGTPKLEEIGEPTLNDFTRLTRRIIKLAGANKGVDFTILDQIEESDRAATTFTYNGSR